MGSFENWGVSHKPGLRKGEGGVKPPPPPPAPHGMARVPTNQMRSAPAIYVHVIGGHNSHLIGWHPRHSAVEVQIQLAKRACHCLETQHAKTLSCEERARY